MYQLWQNRSEWLGVFAVVDVSRSALNLTVFYAQGDLARKLREAASSDGGVKLHFVEAVGPASVRAAAKCLEQLGVADPAFRAVLIDGTRRPTSALRAVQDVAKCIDARLVTVHSELVHPGLELFVRMRGALLLLGPLEPPQWQDYFATVRKTSARLQRDAWHMPARVEAVLRSQASR